MHYETSRGVGSCPQGSKWRALKLTLDEMLEVMQQQKTAIDLDVIAGEATFDLKASPSTDTACRPVPLRVRQSGLLTLMRSRSREWFSGHPNGTLS